MPLPGRTLFSVTVQPEMTWEESTFGSGTSNCHRKETYFRKGCTTKGWHIASEQLRFLPSRQNLSSALSTSGSPDCCGLDVTPYRCSNPCGKGELVSGVHTLVAGVVQVYHRLQVVEEEEKGRKVEQEVEREDQGEETQRMTMHMEMT